jgi:hypothetical protein
MEKNMYCIFDNVSKLYEPPFLEINNGTAIRRLMDLMQQNPQSPYAKFPDNYTLINIGTWNDEDGVPVTDKHTNVAELTAIKTPSDMIKEN